MRQRTVSGLVGWVLAAGAMACSADETRSTPDPPLPGPEEWNRDVTPPSDADAAAQREACGFAKGALPAETQGASHPSGADIPVDTIVLAMMENRSFDHYFYEAASHGIDTDPVPDDFTNPSAMGDPVAPTPDTLYCFVDTPHGWDSTHAQINGGMMDGFVTEAEGSHELPVHGTLDMLSGERAMGYYPKADLPFYYWIAENFTIADRFFSSVAGPTWPNRMYYFAASSFGRRSNDFPEGVEATIIDYLILREISWKFYYTNTPTFGIMLDKYLELNQTGNFVPIAQFYEDARNGDLPQVVFLDPDGTSSREHRRSDEHPPSVMEVGQAWLGQAVAALMEGPHWERSAMFISYDEHGGLFDHVPPPKACPPDDRPPENSDLQFDHLGVRVPMLVVSPYAKKGHVVHDVMDHTSLLRFIEARFVMPALSHRDANAIAPWDAFDFEGAPNKEKKSVPIPTVDEDKLAACDAIYE